MKDLEKKDKTNRMISYVLAGILSIITIIFMFFGMNG